MHYQTKQAQQKEASTPMKILVAGGAGYIGSHTCVALLEVGHTVVVADNFCNSNAETLERVNKLLIRKSHSTR